MWRGLSLACLLAAWLPAFGAEATTMLAGLVTWVDDGDTIRVQLGDRIERVRYIGVNAPEIGSGGADEATRANRELVGHRRVRLAVGAEARDAYGRLLAFVWVGRTLVNAELVRRGYAEVITIRPNLRYQRWLRALEGEARQAGRGLWRTGELPTNKKRGESTTRRRGPALASSTAQASASCWKRRGRPAWFFRSLLALLCQKS